LPQAQTAIRFEYRHAGKRRFASRLAGSRALKRTLQVARAVLVWVIASGEFERQGLTRWGHRRPAIHRQIADIGIT
jgi:hypothetical protein